jgi:hypothetical protein
LDNRRIVKIPAQAKTVPFDFLLGFARSFGKTGWALKGHPTGTQGPSTPQIIAFAMIHSGRDDRVVGDLNRQKPL